MEWRVIDLETVDAYTSQALDELVMDSLVDGGTPMIRMWRWEKSAASVGQDLAIKEKLDLHRCGEMGLQVVRRLTQGDPMYHDSTREFAFSVIAPVDMFGDATDAQMTIDRWVAEGLCKLNIDTQVADIPGVFINGAKAVTTARLCQDGILLLQGSVMNEVVDGVVDRLFMNRGPAVDEIPLTGVSAHIGTTLENTYNAVKNSLVEDKDWKQSAWSIGEMQMATELVRRRYANPDWTFMR